MDPMDAVQTENLAEQPGATVAEEATTVQTRRSSSRTIKRKRFDDEIIEYSIGQAELKQYYRALSESQMYANSLSDTLLPDEAAAMSQSLLPSSDITSMASLPSPPIVSASALLRRLTKGNTTGRRGPVKRAKKNQTGRKGCAKKATKNQGGHQTATKDLGRWKPIDDLALITNVQQTSDLHMVYRGTKFSCKFTMEEVESRWCTLLYDKAISRISVAAIRNLHPELIESVQSKALYSSQEEELLGSIKSTENPTNETFQNLLDEKVQIFHAARTAKALSVHWQLMKQYYLLPDQLMPANNPMSFSDFEDFLNGANLKESKDDALDIELALADRTNKIEIRHLENELPRWNVLVDAVTGIGLTPEFDNLTLAVLRGRIVHYLVQSRDVTFGRTTKDQTVDIDLTLEGPAHKVSRKQGTIHLRSNGDFFILNEGQRPVYIDGMPLLLGNTTQLYNNCVVEMVGLSFIFLVNAELINTIRQDSAKMGDTLN